MRWNLGRVELQLPSTQEEPVINPSNSILLSCPLVCSSLHTIMLLHSSMKKDQSIGRLFSNINPDSNSQFVLEVAAELPDRLPNVRNQAEYLVNVADRDSNLRTLCISNQMVRGDFLRDGIQKLTILPRYLVKELKSEKFPISLNDDTVFKSLRTMVSSRFIMNGSDAENALESSIEHIASTFLVCINKLLKANQMLASGEEYPALPSGYNRSSLDYLYIAIYGESIHKNGFDRISLNFGKVRLNHGKISDFEFQELKAYLELEKEFDDIHLMMISSKNSLDSGMEKLALLQMVIVGQMAVNGYVKKKAKEGGVSNRRFSKYGNRIPYGQTLNVLFPPLCPKKKPEGELLDLLNEARDRRNTLIHEGKMNASKKDLYKYYTATKELIEYIASIENCFIEDEKTSGSDKDIMLSSQASPEQVFPLK